jgi:hypothetical protein
VIDPISLCELALELKMSVAEICYGRGATMSAHELTVTWPLYFAHKERMQKAEAAGRER